MDFFYLFNKEIQWNVGLKTEQIMPSIFIIVHWSNAFNKSDERNTSKET